MLKGLMIVGAVLLLAGGGAAGWWFGLRGEPLPFTAEAAEPGSQPQQPDFVELAPLTFPVMHDGQVSRLMTFVVSLEILGKDAQAAAVRRKPALRDAFYSELHALYGYRFVREHDGRIELIKRRLLKAGRQVVGGELRGVYIQSLNRQPQQQAELPDPARGTR
jgi:hypothetical protein